MTSDDILFISKTAHEAGCKITENVSLSSCTTFGIGGRCPLMIEICSDKAACLLIGALNQKELPFFVIGKGSNLLVSDSSIDMVFLRMGRDFDRIECDGTRLVCEAGASLSALCREAKEQGLTGLEFAYGIPGSVGGAVFMNAGAYGGEIRDVIGYAEAVDKNGLLRRFSPTEMGLSYRHSVFMENGMTITKAAFNLRKGDKDQISAKMNELTEKRRTKQPVEMRSAGSTFKRPEGAYAAALIEQCGLKGFTIGGAQVSPKHSGFVVNTGGASFDDVMAVIDHVRKTVKEQTGFTLETEPVIIRGGAV